MRTVPTRTVIAALALLSLSTAAFAAQTEGKITKVDAEAQTVTLDDGKAYKIPGEFDIATLSEGTEIIIAYDLVNGENLITDMQIDE